MSKQKRKFIFVPPPRAMIERYATDVCRVMGQDYTDTETVSGFTSFVKTLVRIKLQELNGVRKNAPQAA